jgi:hypothetical protein
MRGLTLINTFNFKLSENFSVVINNLLLRNNDTKADVEFLHFPKIWTYLGKIFRDSLISRPYFVRDLDYDNIESFIDEVQSDLAAVNEFFNFMWFSRDCCAYARQLGFYLLVEKKVAIFNDDITFYMSDGSIKYVEITKDDIQESYQIYKVYAEKCSRPNSFQATSYNSTNDIAVHFIGESEYNDLNRIQRTIRFLQLARSTRQLPMKISFYVMILECLFSADEPYNTTVKVSRRVSNYIEPIEEDRAATQDFITESFSIRNKYLHGQQLRENHQSWVQLKPIAIQLDTLVRRVLRQIFLCDIDIFIADQEQFNKWLVESVS